MSLPRNWRELFSPRNTHKLDVGRLMEDLNNPLVRANWLKAVLEQLVAMNLDIDRLLDRGEIDERIREISARRRQLVAVLEQIEASRNSVELEKDHNQDDLLAI